MTTYRAQVRDGRLVLDEPTELPDGEVVELEVADRYRHLEDADELTDKEREPLHAALVAGTESVRAGKGLSLDEVLARMRRA